MSEADAREQIGSEPGECGVTDGPVGPRRAGQQPHITHRPAYLRGRALGAAAAQAGEDYRPRDAAAGSTAAQQAARLGYEDGYAGQAEPAEHHPAVT